jgi:hypothetical protein
MAHEASRFLKPDVISSRRHSQARAHAAVMVAPALAFAGGVAVGAAVAVNALRRRLARRRPRRVLVGLEVAASQSWRILRGANGEDEKNANDKNKKTRVAVFTNHTGVCPRTGRHVVDMLHACASVDLRLVFAPEHGFRGEKQAGYSSGGAATDSITGVAVFDAYRSRGDPAALASVLEEADVDCVVFDVQDVGARFYTYVSSMYDLLVAVARLNNDFSSPSETKTKDKTARRLRKKSRRPRTRVVILDRPNPLGGTTTEGPVVVEPGFDSFVSRVSVPIRHGMTVGNSRFCSTNGSSPPIPVTRRGESWRKQTYAYRRCGGGADGWRGKTPNFRGSRRRPTCRRPPRRWRTSGPACWRPRTRARGGARPRPSS